MPLARKAPTIPVSTSPVPAVARLGWPPSTRTPASGAAISVPGALEQDDAAESLDRPPDRLRAGARRPRTTPRRSAARARRSAESARAAPATRRARAPRERRRRPRPEAAPPRAAGGRTPSCPRSARGPGRPRAPLPSRPARDRGATASSVTKPVGIRRQRALHGLQHRALEDRHRRLGPGERHVARVCAERGERGQARCAGARASRRRRRRGPEVYLLPSGLRRGTELEDRPRHAGVLGLRLLEPDVRHLEIAREEGAGRHVVTDLLAVEGDRQVRVDRRARPPRPSTRPLPTAGRR